MQTFTRGNYDVALSDYFSFIQDKTGELFKASCQSGAFLAGHSESTFEMVGEFGLSLGLNYQIFDDLVDSFGQSHEVGKCLGTDFDSADHHPRSGRGGLRHPPASPKSNLEPLRSPVEPVSIRSFS